MFQYNCTWRWISFLLQSRNKLFKWSCFISCFFTALLVVKILKYSLETFLDAVHGGSVDGSEVAGAALVPHAENVSLSLSLSLWSVSLLTRIQLQKYFIHKSQGRVRGSGLNFNVLFVDYYFSWFNIDKIWKSIYIWELSVWLLAVRGCLRMWGHRRLGAARGHQSPWSWSRLWLRWCGSLSEHQRLEEMQFQSS